MIAVRLVIAPLFLLAALISGAQAPSGPRDSGTVEALYTGTWVTTNRKLDGTMNCQIKHLAADRWQGRFWGVWQQVPFDYTVEFAKQSAPNVAETGRKTVRLIDAETENRVSGKAMIDGASYDWTGTLTANKFNIIFTGSRYEGNCELARVRDRAAARPSPTANR